MLTPLLPTAQPDPPEGGGSSNSTLLYGLIGSAVVLVGLAILVVAVLLGKRRRVMAKIWRPTSPSEPSPATDGAVSSGTTNVSAAQSAM